MAHRGGPALTAAVATRAAEATGAERRSRGRTTAWWGMVLLITTEAMIFAGLLSAYFFVRAASTEWPLGSIEAPELQRISAFTAVLLGSSIPVFWADAAIKRGDVGRCRAGLLLGFLMGAAFLVHQGFEYHDLRFGWGDNAYGSLFYAITGLHGLHVLGGLLMSVVVQAKAWTGRVSGKAHTTVEVFGLYWHFVDAVWIAVFSSLYLSAQLG